jgi:hypothetical protein
MTIHCEAIACDACRLCIPGRLIDKTGRVSEEEKGETGPRGGY